MLVAALGRLETVNARCCLEFLETAKLSPELYILSFTLSGTGNRAPYSESYLVFSFIVKINL